MAASEFPTSYKDPTYASLDSATEQKLGLPTGLLSAIRTRGERTNHDQISEAGASTVYQIIPATRKAAIDKWGIDPMLSPQNASEVAGLLLKDSLTRNQGDPKLAVAEYIGGTDRANWGPRTRSYVQRVVGAAPPPPIVPTTGAMPDGTPSTFDRVSAQMNGPTSSQIANVYAAYQAGQMPAEDAAQFEADVNAGRVMLPRGAALKAAAGATEAPAADAGVGTGGELPPGVVQAYASGQMPVADRIQLEQDVKQGLVKMPDGVEVHDTKAPGFLARVGESITGSERRVPETEALPEWTQMPELTQLTIPGMKTGIGTLLASTPEAVQIVQANFPGVKVRQDAKGSPIFTSAIDGKDYAIKPGLRLSDTPRVLGGMAAFSPVGAARTIGGAALGAGATQAAIETSQAATGGEFNPGEVGMAAVMGGAGPLAGNLVRAGAKPAQALLTRARGLPDPAAAAMEAPGAVPGARVAPPNETPAPNLTTGAVTSPVLPVAPAAVPAEMSAAELAQTAKKAAEGGMGSKAATETLASQAAPNPKTLEAAKRLGIEDYLQPDHVTTSQAYRELAQAVKSVPGSEAHAAELAGLEKVGRRADDLINEIGGTSDVSALDASVKGRMQGTQAELEQQAEKLYGKVRAAIPAKTAAPADNTLGFLKQHADEVGGEARLLPTERKLLSALDGDGSPLTYAYLDQVRKQIGQAMRKASGPFADSESGMLKKLYGTLSQDQQAVAEAAGAGDLYKAASASVAVRKGIEDDMKSLFGKEATGSLVGPLSSSVRALPSGDASKLIRLLSAVPLEMRQEVAASGLASAFRTAGTRGPISFGTFEKWYDGLLRNKQAHAALMTNLPPQARKQISDLYRVSKGISAATKERITTGRIQAVQEQFKFKAADTLAGKLYEAAKRGAVGATVGTAAGSVLGPGVGAAIASALTRGAKPAADKAVDALIASPEFIAAARAAGGSGQAAAVRSLAYSKNFTRFVRALGQPRELSNRERWLMQALQADNQTRR